MAGSSPRLQTANRLFLCPQERYHNCVHSQAVHRKDVSKILWTQPQGGTVPRPTTGETPIRHVRIADKLWSEIARIAREEDRSRTSVVLEALTRYVAWHSRKPKGK